MFKIYRLLAILFVISFISCQPPQKNSGDNNERPNSVVEKGEDNVPHENRQVHHSDNFYSSQSSSGSQNGTGASGIKVIQPKAGTEISSPLEISGKARGNWFFEAEFTVELVQNGQTLTIAIVKAQDDWMTEDYVPFSATLKFSEVGAAGEAQLVFRNSNPSEKPELNKTYLLPVKIAEKWTPKDD